MNLTPKQPTDYASCPNLAAMFFEQAERLGESPFLWAKRNGCYIATSGREAAALAGALAHGLRNLGLVRGDRVMLVSENRPEWLIADVGIMAAGGITVPAYTTNTVADHLHILKDAQPRVAIVSTPALAARVIQAAAQVACPPIVVTIDPFESAPVPTPALARWSDLTAHPPTPCAELGREDTACIIYTSGTGGAPKGVMLSHGAILHNCMGAQDVLAEIGLEDEVFLSFLPLSHSYEHTAGQFFPVSIGAQIYYAEGLDRLSANLLEARPTIMTAVPRLYETLRSRILLGVARQGGLKKALFDRAVTLGRQRYETPGGLGLGARLENLVLDRLVRRKVAARFGGRLKAMVSGGAPLPYEVGLFFIALGVPILQGYGQTESAPIISCTRRSHINLRTAGPPLKEVLVCIADDGEILVRGPLLMQGYWGNEEATRAAIDPEGWLHTGDIGVIDTDGSIWITDRKKDIIVNSGGDNVSPQRLEGMLVMEPEITQAMVYGDRRPHLVALIVPDPEFATAWAAENGHATGLELLCREEAFHKAMTAAVARVNRTLSPIEKIRRFILIDEPFSVANEQLTPTMKIRRHKIREKYGAALEALY
ncbi:MAG: long-chain fatty acid--CoA ligase [Alphaproteobacteria bacterium]|nr:long-chain fatty acid--CoA ligase [Alphaproteobacteria bacterium]